MKKLVLAALVLAAAGLAIVAQSAFSNSRGEASGGSRVVSALGVAQVQGESSFVHVTVVVPPGRDDRATVAAALWEQGARPAHPGDLEESEFTTSGLVWDQFFDGNPATSFVTQSYNPANDPTGGAGEAALLNSQAMWTDVASSSFAFQYGGQTDRCPSLVRECSGPQYYDGNNDVAWLGLGGCCTLGVTWYSTSIDEADMALNTKFAWSATCADVARRFDVQTVFGHENGHVGGLGHSDDPNALMYASYQRAMCFLGQDDIDGISALYPADGSPPPTATPTPTPTPTPAESEPTPTPDGDVCPPGHQRRGLC